MKQSLIWNNRCPFCNQGRLYIFKNLDVNKLYLHCEECERGYYNPNQLNVENSFLTLTDNFSAVEATLNDIYEHNWDISKINLVT